MLVNNTLQERPANGAGVWVTEADGDMVVWMGQWAPAGTDVDALLTHGHEQYLTNAKHDITARHTFGAALGTPSAPPDIAVTSSAGSGASPSRSDHTHKVGSGAINSSGMFAAGVVNTAALASFGPGAVGPIGDSSHSSAVTLDVKGRVSNLTSVLITPAAIGAPSGSGTVTGVNTGDQTITLTGFVSGSGTGTISTSLASSISQSQLATDAQVWAGSFTGTTDGSGLLTVNYGRSFLGTPDPTACMGDSTSGGSNAALVVRHGANTVSSFSVRVLKISDGSVIASETVRINWVAKEP